MVVGHRTSCNTARVIACRPGPEQTLSPEAARATPNPYAVALAAVGAFAWLLALMLWQVLAQVTDCETYDVASVTALTDWINLLIVAGVVGIAGSLVIARVRHEILVRTDARPTSWPPEDRSRSDAVGGLPISERDGGVG